MSNYKPNTFSLFSNESGYELFEHMPSFKPARTVRVYRPNKIRIKIYL